MKTNTALTTVLILIFLNLHQTSQSQEFRNFSNTSGKVIKAKIVSATAEEVTLQMENGRTITGGVNFFSTEDQAFIKEFARKNPISIKYAFDVQAAKNRLSRDKKKEGSSIIATYESWIYKITVENRSRTANNKGADLKGLTMHYNIVLTPKAELREAAYLLKDSAASGKHRVIKGKVSMQSMAYLDESEFSTIKFPIGKSELAAGYYYPDGGKDNREDDLEGILIKILNGKEVVYETIIGSKALENVRWAAP